MAIRDGIGRARRGLTRRLRREAAIPHASFTGTPSQRQSEGDLADLFYSHDGRLLHKWDHYLPIYERYLARFRGTNVRLLELGVFQGGSLQLWRRYFGPEAIIYGIDIDPRCAALGTPDLPIRVGSQDDPAFLRGVIAEMGGVDVVIDDGSHVGRHQRASLEICYKLLSPNGVYLVEDLHASYWGGFFEGGLRRPGTFIEHTKGLIDRMHAVYRGIDDAEAMSLGAIHVHDSIVAIEKASRVRPFHVKIGRPSR